MAGIEIHRQDDSRSCGATTVVTGQGNVYANGKLVSVNGDPNSHGAGNLIATSNNVYVNGILVVHNGDNASADNLCPPLGGQHCSPEAVTGSPDVFVGD